MCRPGRPAKPDISTWCSMTTNKLSTLKQSTNKLSLRRPSGFVRAWSIASLVFAALTVGMASGRACGEIPLPQVSDPLPVTATSYPQLAADRTDPKIDLAQHGYVEQERFVTGQANIYEHDAHG